MQLASVASDLPNPGAKRTIGEDKEAAKASSRKAPAIGASLVPAFREELAKRGCLKAEAEDGWGERAKRGLKDFARIAKLKDVNPDELTDEMLEKIRSNDGTCAPAGGSKPRIQEARQSLEEEDEVAAKKAKPSPTPRPQQARKPVEEDEDEAPAKKAKPSPTPRPQQARKPVEEEEDEAPAKKAKPGPTPRPQQARKPAVEEEDD